MVVAVVVVHPGLVEGDLDPLADTHPLALGVQRGPGPIYRDGVVGRPAHVAKVDDAPNRHPHLRRGEHVVSHGHEDLAGPMALAAAAGEHHDRERDGTGQASQGGVDGGSARLHDRLRLDFGGRIITSGSAILWPGLFLA